MKKILFLFSISICCAFGLIYFDAPKQSDLEPSTSQKMSSQLTEHNILLDLTSPEDQVIYDNLLYSNYNCTLINPKQAVCKQFHVENMTTVASQPVELYKYTANGGKKEFKIFHEPGGAAYIEFKLNSSDVLYRYSFTSLDKISLFTDEKGLFTTGPVEWDISSLFYVL